MSLRVTACLLFVVALSIYAYRDWFRSLCGAIFLLAFLEHPDMPRSIAGIQGFNLWNVLYGNIVVAWLVSRGREGLVWDMPRRLALALVLYVLVICVAFGRAFLDPTQFYEGSRLTMTVNYLINPLKFLLPCVLLYDGARSRDRVIMALGALGLYFLALAGMIIRYGGFNFDFSGDELTSRAVKIVARSTGYHRVEMSMMLAGASWAFVAAAQAALPKTLRWGLASGAVVVVLAQAMTGGRTGYLSWVLVGLLLCTIKWRKLLPLFPLAVVALVTLMPGVRGRMLAGFALGGDSSPVVREHDSNEITSGRTEVWPHVIQKIKESPWIGYGRIAMVRTGLYLWVREELNDGFQHPHNAYLEQLLDGGIFGFLSLLPVYLCAVFTGVSLFLDRQDRLFEATGGFALALMLSLLIGSIGGQTLYPREGTVGVWAAAGLAWRVWVERRKWRQGDHSSLLTHEAAGGWQATQQSTSGDPLTSGGAVL